MPIFSAVRGFESTLQLVDEHPFTSRCLGDLLSHLGGAVPCPATQAFVEAGGEQVEMPLYSGAFDCQ